MSNTSISATLVSDAHVIFRAAIRRVQADRLSESSPPETWAARKPTDYDTVQAVGMGKAAMAMAGVLEERHEGLVNDGTVVVPEGYPETYPDRLPVPDAIRVMEGGHPLPTEQSVRAARRMLEHARGLDEGDLLLVLVSGGGTALSSLPVEFIDLADLKTTYHRLLTAGVPIEPANVVRKHLTQVGGGQLARAAHPAHVGALVVSDVVGDDPSVIASGPTVPDPSTYDEAMQVLYQHQLWHDVPASVREHLAAGARDKRPETPSEDDPCFDMTKTTLLGTNQMALDAARTAAEERGYQVRVASGVEGEARNVAHQHVQTMLEADPEKPTCWLWGGETTVTVTGDGTGGRNQELALAGAIALDDADVDAVLLSGGSDGIDGPTDAAGAWTTPETAEAARTVGCDPEAHLQDNDSYTLFDRIDQLLRPGPTHTNVMDVQVGLVHPS